jgi:hypothetical protein
VAETAGTGGTPAEIEARIAQRRAALAETLDEIAVRVHPKTLMYDVKARAVETVDGAASRASAAAGRAVSSVRAQFVSETGAPRLERIVPLALVAAAGAGLLALGSRRRHS